MTKNYNHEITNLASLEHRHANIRCHGGYGNNPDVIMLSRESTIYKGFIKEVQIDTAKKKGEEVTLIVKSTEYGHEITLPYHKVISMNILSSKEQALIEEYIAKKDTWKETMELIDSVPENEMPIEKKDEIREAFNNREKYAKELIAKGVKTYE